MEYTQDELQLQTEQETKKNRTFLQAMSMGDTLKFWKKKKTEKGRGPGAA